jgi:hypothetical protein
MSTNDPLAPALPQPKPQSSILSNPPLKSGLLSIGDQLFEVNHNTGSLRPYGDKPTAKQNAMASGLQFLVPSLVHPDRANSFSSRLNDIASQVASFAPRVGTQWTPPKPPDIQYAPLENSNVYHGVYTMSPQAVIGKLMDNLEIPYTPDSIQPNTGPEGGWRVHNPSTNDWDIYK